MFSPPQCDVMFVPNCPSMEHKTANLVIVVLLLVLQTGFIALTDRRIGIARNGRYK